MDKKETLQKAIEEELLMLPKETQAVLRDFPWFEILEDIGVKSALLEEEITGLQTETALLLVGVMSPEEYKQKLINEVGLTENEANKIQKEVLEKILEPIAEQITSKIKQGVNQRNTDIEQNISFILSGGNYIYLTDSLRKKIDKSFIQKTPVSPTKTSLVSQFKI